VRVDTALNTTAASKAQTVSIMQIRRRAGWPNSLIASLLSQLVGSANGLWTSAEMDLEPFSRKHSLTGHRNCISAAPT